MPSWLISETPAKQAAFGVPAASVLTTMLGAELGAVPAPPTVVVGATGTNTIAVSWTASVAPADAPVQGYDVWLERLDHVGSDAFYVPEKRATQTTRAYSYVGLLPGTRYAVWVVAFNKWGHANPSNKPVVVTSGGLVPSAPGAPNESNVLANSMNLAWQPATTPSGTTITEYRIYNRGIFYVTAGTALNKTVTGLATGTDYEWSVSAVNVNGEGPRSAETSVTTTGTVNPGTTTIVYAAGDVAHATFIADAKRTGALINGRTDKNIVLALGDLAYSMGSTANYNDLYHPSWGMFKDITFPTLGNHETPPQLLGYRAYWGARVQTNGNAYYSFIRNNWLFLSMDSSDAQGSTAGSGIEAGQVTWAQGVIDNAPSSVVGILAYWHHPRFTSGNDGNNLDTSAMVNMLRTRNADIVLCGHDHNYERFAKLNAAGTARDDLGIRHFTVGTGGSGPRGASSVKFGSEKFFGNGASFAQGRRTGVLRLALTQTNYSWQWLDASNPAGSETDTGTTTLNPK